MCVVAKKMCTGIQELASEGKISLTQRAFRDSDVDGMFLAFAATDDRGVNLQVLAACRERGVLCCPVDKSWPEGDFVTPATFRKDGLVVAVSTGGRSCRRSRLVKENLARHVDSVVTSDLLVMGTSHEFMSVEEREPYHLAGERLQRTGDMLAQVWGVHEFLLLNTCNRIELIAAVARDTGADPLLERILGFDALPPDRFYVRRGFEAFQHLALVTGGLLSQSPGEDHIIAQVKETLEACEQAGWANGVMRGWIGYALHLSRDIRAAVAGMLHPGEIEDICFQYLDAEGPDPSQAQVLVVGAGVMGRGVVERAVRRGYSCTWCYHVNVPDIPARWADAVKLCGMDELPARLREARVVFTAAGGSEHVLTGEHADALGTGQRTVVFDLGIPRNVDPALEDADGVHVLDLDDLKAFHARELADVTGAIQAAARVVEDHREMYDRIVESLQGRGEE